MRLLLLNAAAAVLSTVLATSAQAQSVRRYSCEELWLERNTIYKDAGFCFQTRRAISQFGNAGCRYDEIRDVPLSANDRQRVQILVREEGQKGCSR